MRLAGTFAAAALAAAIGLTSGAALAGGRLKERVYDDSFGNLIIISPSGYKRIVVGMGHVAVEMEAESRAVAGYGAPGRDGLSYTPHCHRPPVLWKGRSYMYGLADGEIPVPPLVCE